MPYLATLAVVAKVAQHNSVQCTRSPRIIYASNHWKSRMG